MMTERVIYMKDFETSVRLSEGAKKRLQKFLGGASYDVDHTEMCAFVYGVANEFWEHAWQYSGDLQTVVEGFYLKAEIAKAIADGAATSEN